jgi:hypothetical protein
MAVAAKPAGKAGRGWVKVDIERLVTWALRDQGLGWVADSSFSADGLARGARHAVDTSIRARIRRLGCSTATTRCWLSPIERLPVGSGRAADPLRANGAQARVGR